MTRWSPQRNSALLIPRVACRFSLWASRSCIGTISIQSIIPYPHAPWRANNPPAFQRGPTWRMNEYNYQPINQSMDQWRIRFSNTWWCSESPACSDRLASKRISALWFLFFVACSALVWKFENSYDCYWRWKTSICLIYFYDSDWYTLAAVIIWWERTDAYTH